VSPHATTNRKLRSAFAELSTPLLADACVRLKLSLRIAPPTIRPIKAKSRLAGRVLPVRHYGSVDIFLEALEAGQAGDVLVIDNGGRTDEGCVGDLTALETKACGLAGIMVWAATGIRLNSSRLGSQFLVTESVWLARYALIDAMKMRLPTRISGTLS